MSNVCNISITFLVRKQATKLHATGRKTARKKFIKDNSQRKIQKDATIYQIFSFSIYMKLNMFRATHRPSSGA